MINLILFGPPGSGKGTQSELLAKKYGLVHLSTGDVLRREIENKSKIGKQVKDYLKNGHLVPDDLVLEVLNNEIHNNGKAKGIIFDGFPRTVHQAEKLRGILEHENVSVSAFIALEADDEELLNRLLLRGIRENRIDDTASTIKNRIEVYKEKTLPLKEFYKDRLKYTSIDGMQSIEEVFDDISEILNILVSDERLAEI